MSVGFYSSQYKTKSLTTTTSPAEKKKKMESNCVMAASSSSSIAQTVGDIFRFRTLKESRSTWQNYISVLLAATSASDPDAPFSLSQLLHVRTADAQHSTAEDFAVSAYLQVICQLAVT